MSMIERTSRRRGAVHYLIYLAGQVPVHSSESVLEVFGELS
jgi:hypothetical protein